MEPAQTQLARALPHLRLDFSTADPSIHGDRVSLSYMHEWYSFAQDAFVLFQQMSITHDIAVQNEDELYTVGSETGVSGPIRPKPMRPSDESTRFADIQAIAQANEIVPDISFFGSRQ